MLTVSVLCFSARALKKNIFFDVDIVAKKKSNCGFSWSVLLPTTSRCHYLFPKHYGVCNMSGYDELLRDDKFATLTSSFLKFCNSWIKFVQSTFYEVINFYVSPANLYAVSFHSTRSDTRVRFDSGVIFLDQSEL